MKEEYREQMRLQQERTDLNQKIALEYTAKVRDPRIMPATVSVATNKVKCPSCGEKVEKAKFCSNCGAKL